MLKVGDILQPQIWPSPPPKEPDFSPGSDTRIAFFSAIYQDRVWHENHQAALNYQDPVKGIFRTWFIQVYNLASTPADANPPLPAVQMVIRVYFDSTSSEPQYEFIPDPSGKLVCDPILLDGTVYGRKVSPTAPAVLPPHVGDTLPVPLGDTMPYGSIISDGQGGKWQKMMSLTPFGIEKWYQKVS